ncbi:flagellar hook-length control protein FliK [Undibacterium sp. Jales W-56]|uniref:flagellar hook-length control protein FliK n=1 Tax=Undibacterium sp. Jales W-56 TaxID=2897325 RepID=UPI0021CFA1F3|nr:flagellar hook-length control protein FliK [Undibacterium sp. Jales W-56]MCU6435382.1 flagellar hook-length control protein FliK [Undibacterium sp. Jales W-56]
MLPRVDNLLRPVAAIEAPSAVASLTETKQEVVSKLEQLVIGRQLQGEVLSRLNDGTFLVKIAGTTARMNLPADSKTGDVLNLKLLTTDPRPTFILGSGNEIATETAIFPKQTLLEQALQDVTTEHAETISTDLSKAAKTSPKATPDQAITTSTPTTISNTGKLIDSILHVVQEKGTSNALAGTTPIAEHTDILKSPADLSTQLQKTISSSGLFYESHLADLADGKRSIADIRSEPQAQQSIQIEEAEVSKQPDNQLTAPTNKPLANTELTQLIHLQLDTLEQQKIVWQGNLLPNLPMQWEIVRDNRGQAKPSSESDDAWQSTVRFELPNLGTISATINLRGEHVQLFVRTNKSATADVLKTRVSELANSLKNAGSSLDGISVKQDDNA